MKFEMIYQVLWLLH